LAEASRLEHHTCVDQKIMRVEGAEFLDAVFMRRDGARRGRFIAGTGSIARQKPIHTGGPRMLISGSTLVGLGLLGYFLALAPHVVEHLIGRALGWSVPVQSIVPQHVLLSLSGAVYLSGVVLVAAHLLRRAAIRLLRQMADERADLESLHIAGARSLELIETGLRTAEKRRDAALDEARRLASDFVGVPDRVARR
jgi:hypothetical protein